MTSFLISEPSLAHSLCPSKMRFFPNFFISQPIKLNFGTGIQNWILIFIFGSKSGFGDNFRQYDTKTIILRLLLPAFWSNAS